MMYDVEFTFNGVTSQEMNLYNVRVNQSDVTHLFNAAKQLTTAKAFYGDRNIITNIDTEPLTFSLTFTSLEGSFTISRIREIFKWFDVNDYAPLSFGSNPDFYYNVMPLTSQQDLYLFNNDAGYFTIDFVCDCGHGWISRHYHYDFNTENWSDVPQIYNESNVKNKEGNYRVYPYIIFKDNTSLYGVETPRYIAIQSSGADSENEDSWLSISDYEPDDRIEIDNRNLFFYAEKTTNLIDIILENDKNKIFKTGRGFYISEGWNKIWRQVKADDFYAKGIRPAYSMDMYFDFPVME